MNKEAMKLAAVELLSIASARAGTFAGAQAAQAAAELLTELARHPFSDIPAEFEVWTGPDLCAELDHQTVEHHFGLRAA